MSVLSLSYYESDVTIRNISQSFFDIMSEKTAGIDWYEDITSLSPYVCTGTSERMLYETPSE